MHRAGNCHFQLSDDWVCHCSSETVTAALKLRLPFKAVTAALRSVVTAGFGQ